MKDGANNGIIIRRDIFRIMDSLSAEQVKVLFVAVMLALDGNPLPSLDEQTKAACDEILSWQGEVYDGTGKVD